MCREARKCGYVTTITNRRRYLEGFSSSDDMAARSLAERQAVNSVIQGSASELIKQAMIDMEALLHSDHWPAAWNKPRLVMQIHDEVVYVVPLGMDDDKKAVRRFTNLLKHCLEERVKETFSISVPLTANISCSNVSWGALQNVHEFLNSTV